MTKDFTDAIIVSFHRNESDGCILIIGRKGPGHATDIINAFEGEEAVELYQKLITKKD